VKHPVTLHPSLPSACGPRNLELELADAPSLGDIVAALRNAVPELVGRVIQADEDRLTSHYVFSVNGRLCLDDYSRRVEEHDRVMLLAIPLGG
jgi:molybdopterin converting factor small subunit